MVKEVIIQGKTLHVAFNMKAIFAFQKSTGKSLNALDNMMKDGDTLEALIYEGLKEGHRLKGVELTIEKEDILAITAKDLEQYTTAIAESFEAEPVKKKTGKSKEVIPKLSQKK